MKSAGKYMSKRALKKKLWVGREKEFYNKHVQELTHLYSTENEEKSSDGWCNGRDDKGKDV